MNTLNTPPKKSKGNSKNNFKNAENTAKAQYKLWVVYKTGMFHVKHKDYFGYLTKPDKGLGSLKRLVHSREQIIEKAIIYDRFMDPKNSVVFEYPSKTNQ